MSVFSGGHPLVDSIRSRRAVDVAGSLGIGFNIDTPGAAPVASFAPAQRANNLAQLLGVLNTGANLIGTVASIHAQDRRQIERESQEEADRHAQYDRAMDTLQAGYAVERGNVLQAQLADDIAEGRLEKPDEISIDEWIGGIVDAHTPQNAGEAYRTALRRNIGPAIAETWTKRENAVETARINEDLALAGNAITNATTTDEINKIIADARLIVPDTVTDSQLYSRLILPALRSAAAVPDAERFKALTAALDGRFTNDQREALQIFENAVDRQQNEAAREATRHVSAMILAQEATDTINQRIDEMESDGTIDRFAAETLRENLRKDQQNKLAELQGSNINTLQMQIELNRISPAELDREIDARIQLPENDPRFITAQQGHSLRRMYVGQQIANRAADQVNAAMSGQPVQLTPSQHADALADYVGPDGMGYIDGFNRIAKPVQLADSLITSGFIPTPTRQIIERSLASDNASQVGAAAFAIGTIAAADDRLYAQLINAAPESLRPAIDEAASRFRSGDFREAEGQGGAIAGIRAALDADIQTQRKPDAELRQAKKRELRNLSENIIKQASNVQPHTKNAALLWGLLWPNPDLETENVAVNQQIEDWYLTRYKEVEATRGASVAEEAAFNYARGMFRDTYDLVRWNGKVRAARVKGGEGLDLPRWMRWGEGYEAEAKKDIAERIKADAQGKERTLPQGFELEDIATLRPFKTGNPNDMGWAYVLEDGSDLVDNQGKLVLYTPTPQTVTMKTLLEQEIIQARMRRLKAGRTGDLDPQIVEDTFRYSTDQSNINPWADLNLFQPPQQTAARED